MDDITPVETDKNENERLAAEYFELKDHTYELRRMIDYWVHGRGEEPVCSVDLLTAQLRAMETYESILAERCRVEGVTLTR